MGIAETIYAQAKAVVVGNPYAQNCVVLRKSILRPDPVDGDFPTFGGCGVLSSLDEESFDWEILGYGVFVFIDNAPKPIDGNNSSSSMTMLLYPEASPGEEGYFEIKRQDVVQQIIGKYYLAYEIMDIEYMVNIPPYCVRYIANTRDDLSMVLAE